MARTKKVKEPKRIKKIVANNTLKERVKMVATKQGGRPPRVDHVLRLTDWLYITCDSHTWILKEISDKVNPKTKERYPDKNLLYATDLCNMLKIAVRYGVKTIPKDVAELAKKIDHIYELINARIPADVKPSDLFEDCKPVEEDD